MMNKNIITTIIAKNNQTKKLILTPSINRSHNIYVYLLRNYEKEFIYIKMCKWGLYFDDIFRLITDVETKRKGFNIAAQFCRLELVKLLIEDEMLVIEDINKRYLESYDILRDSCPKYGSVFLDAPMFFYDGRFDTYFYYELKRPPKVVMDVNRKDKNKIVEILLRDERFSALKMQKTE